MDGGVALYQNLTVVMYVTCIIKIIYMYMYYRLILYLKSSNWMILHVLIMEIVNIFKSIQWYEMLYMNMMCFKRKWNQERKVQSLTSKECSILV